MSGTTPKINPLNDSGRHLSLFPEVNGPTAESHCPTCDKNSFSEIGGGLFRCVHCRWLVKFEGCRAVDGIDWTRTMQKRSKRKRGPRA